LTITDLLKAIFSHFWTTLHVIINTVQICSNLNLLLFISYPTQCHIMAATDTIS